MCDLSFEMLLDLCLNTDFGNKGKSWLTWPESYLPLPLASLKSRGAFLIL